MSLKPWHGLVALVALVLAGLSAYLYREKDTRAVTFTVGDLRTVHAEVRIGETPVQGEQRISDGDTISTGPEGRARVRLDDGTIVAVDRSTRFGLKDNRLSLATGRIFVQGGPTAATEVSIGAAKTTVASSAVAFEAAEKAGSIYCATGELVVNFDGVQTRVESGESARLVAGKLEVKPEKAFDDWTGGLAVPWTSGAGARSTIPGVRAVNQSDEVGTPLVIRSQDVKVEVDGEVAVTRARTTYFNGSNTASHAKLQFALPEGAILRRVAYEKSGWDREQEATLAITGKPGTSGPVIQGIEWAGGGRLRGDLGLIEAGKTVALTLEYVEWLSMRDDRATYRFLMDGGEKPPVVGELSAEVDVRKAHTPFVAVSGGANLKEGIVQYRAADARTTGDLVVELKPRVVRSEIARAYVKKVSGNQDPYVMIRTEVPERRATGVSLAIVLDSSTSVGAATLETERAVVDALLEGLGPKDSVVLLAADQTVRPLGAKAPVPITPKLRDALRAELGRLRPGGASNIGVALQHAADLLDAPSRGDAAGTGMVVYVGDGRPNVGASDATAIRRLMRRRVGGIPRMGAIAVGPAADRWLLAKLVAGAGSMYEVLDRSDASRAGAALLTDALRPTVRDVELDLGPTIDRIYPRESRAVLAGSTLTVVGRLRDKLPKSIGFSYRDGSKLVKESRVVQRTLLPEGADLPQRWALARIQEMAGRDEPVEPAVALAHEAKLLTPWTSWYFEPSTAGQGSRPFSERVLELSSEFDTPFAAHVDTLSGAGSTLLEPPRKFGGGVSLQAAVEVSLKRILERAKNSIRACRDARATVRPDVGTSFVIDLSVSGQGQATRVRVTLGQGQKDPVLERCIEGVVKSLPYVAAGVAASVEHTLVVPEGRATKRTRCSEASKVSLPLRREIWRARSQFSAEAYVQAARACELPRWTDKRALLMMMIENESFGENRLALAKALDDAGEPDAAQFVRQETLRRVDDFAELEKLSRILTEDEPDIDDELDKSYKNAQGNEAKLGVVRNFLRLAPHNPLARRRELALLEALGRKEALVQQIRNLRAEAFLDAGLLSMGASALRRVGLASEGLRTFGDLIERAPRDPWTLAYVGDRLRAEGMFDEAGAAYERLAHAMPDDAGVMLRVALAHAGAGRLDVATRVLDRITRTGGRGDDGRVGELASITRAVLLAQARQKAEGDEKTQLTRRLLETPLPDVKSVVLVQWPPENEPIEVRVRRGAGQGETQTPDFEAASVGIAAVRIERGDDTPAIVLRRPKDPGPSRPAPAVIAALVMSGDRAEMRVVPRSVEVSADGKGVELQFDGENFL